MKNRSTKPALSLLVMTGSLAAAFGWSSDSYACSSEPFISSVCIMATPGLQSGFGNGMYVPAAGQTLQISSNAALYSLIGMTYGGTTNVNFKLPDLRGRVVVGAGTGTGLPTYSVGAMGGTPTVTLSVANLPPHAHSLAGVAVNSGIGTLAATTTLSGLSATTSMSGVTATAAASGLTLQASSASGNNGSPSGNALASTGFTQIYTNATPNVTMAAGAIGGSAPVSFSGNPTTTISGTPSTRLTGAPAVSVSGSTGITGMGSAVNIMQPYLAMTYYVAVKGLYPTSN